MPTVSIGLPVYNGADHLPEVLQALLTQTFEDFELLISDNASTDVTEDICRSYAAQDKRVRYVRMQQNLGPLGNFNKVFDLGSGEYFMWAAHDDGWQPTYIQRCLDAHQLAADIIVTGAQAEVVDMATGTPRFTDEGFSTVGLSARARFMRYKETIHNGHHYGAIFYGLFKRNALRTMMPLEKLICSDHILLAKLCFIGSMYTVPEILFRKGWGGTSKSFESVAQVLDLPDGIATRCPMLARELRLQQVIATTSYLTLADKLLLAVWSWSNYIKRHGLYDGISYSRWKMRRNPLLLEGLNRVVRAGKVLW